MARASNRDRNRITSELLQALGAQVCVQREESARVCGMRNLH